MLQHIRQRLWQYWTVWLVAYERNWWKSRLQSTLTASRQLQPLTASTIKSLLIEDGLKRFDITVGGKPGNDSVGTWHNGIEQNETVDKLEREDARFRRIGSKSFVPSSLKKQIYKIRIGWKRGNRLNGTSVKGMGPANYIWKDQRFFSSERIVITKLNFTF